MSSTSNVRSRLRGSEWCINKNKTHKCMTSAKDIDKTHKCITSAKDIGSENIKNI